MTEFDRDEMAVTLFEESGDALFLFDPASEDMIDVNPMAERLSGFPYAVLRKMQVTYLFRSTGKGGVQRLRHAFQRTGLFHSQEDFLLRHQRDGVWVPVNLTVTRLHARRKTLGLITARDISERKRFEASLLHERYLLHSLLDNSPDHIYFKDTESRFIRLNKATADRLGVGDPALADGKTEADFLNADFARQARADEQNVMQTGQPLIGKVEKLIDAQGREVWLSATKVPLRDTAGPVAGTLTIARDISEHKRLEEQLRQAQKMEAVGRLAGGVAHDFNNLLTIILGYGSLLQEQVRPSDPLYEAIGVIRSTAERAAALTRQLLAFSRKQLLMPVVLDLNAVLADLKPMLQRLIGEDIRLETELAADLGAVKADRNQLEQVVMNLVVNARDAMPKGGSLTLATANEDTLTRQNGEPPDSIPLSGIIQARSSGPYVVLTVRDTGHGMDERTRAHLFEPFFTTKEIGKGTGLGLATVYGIVKQSGGRISVDSTPGAGTTFRIALPRAASPADGSPAVAPSLSAPTSPVGRETVLLVEDEEMLRNLAGMVLQKAGYTVLPARHGAEALSLCESHRGPLHLLLTDVIMPLLSGRELADRLATIRPNVKVLYISGYTDDAVVHHGVGVEGTPFLHKPFTPSVLLRKVREVLDHKPALIGVEASGVA